MTKLAFVCVLAVGCGGRVAGADGGTGNQEPSSGEGGSTGSSGGVPTTNLPCPILPPAVGDSCSLSSDEICAYYVDQMACQAVECDGTGHWVSTRQGC